MTTQPEALRLADELEHPNALGRPASSAAAELRRQHERIAELEAALDVALEAMQSLDGVGTVVQWAGQWELVHAAIAKLKEMN